ncbi:hypothetical protein ELE36_12015 [Pseudolysobacter antarcticus]|uniref:Uncharacterized protein n=1 Tax=Pseudolysobacter antarcticus TaxID=2511995 RepID=A0A411HKH1_9GAMM|nr:hypothetical protein [Pseudolysobacter antarcticus]QBB71015.1 hypothetical protein ELE36_12015 [Pseudolysobacter antarcticus]
MASIKGTSIIKIFRGAVAYIGAGAFGGIVVWVGQGRSLQISPMSVSYPDLIAVLLTAVALIVAIFGVVMAILAIFGYRHFKGVVERASKTSAEEVVTKTAKELVVEEINSEKVKQLIISEVGRIIESEKSGTVSAWLKERERQQNALNEIDHDNGGSR